MPAGTIQLVDSRNFHNFGRTFLKGAQSRFHAVQELKQSCAPIHLADLASPLRLMSHDYPDSPDPQWTRFDV